MTYKEIAKELGVSHQRVVQIEQAALKKVLKILLSKGYLKEYVL